MIDATSQGEAIALADTGSYVMYRQDVHETTWAVMSACERSHATYPWQDWQRGQGQAKSYWSHMNRNWNGK